MMKLVQVMEQLASEGSEQTRKTYGRHGVKAEMFGVSFAFLRKFAKQIGANQPLADELWATGNHDARVLATLIADASKLDLNLLESWMAQIEDPPLTDMFVEMLARTPLLASAIEKWRGAERELTAKLWWNLIARSALEANGPAEDAFEKLIEAIEADIHQRPDRVRHAMNMALCAIGARSQALNARALQAAVRIGKVQVDHGQTYCKTPDAAEYIAKTVGRRGFVV